MKRKKTGVMFSCLLALAMVAGTVCFSFAAGNISEVTLTPGTRNVQVNWKAYDGAHKYVVRCAGKNYETTGTSKNITGLKVDTQYGFIIRAYDNEGKLIAESSRKDTKTLGVKNVTHFKANAGYKSITITFTKVPGATCYELYRKNNKTGKWQIIKQKTGKYKGRNIGHGGANVDTKYSKDQIVFKDTEANERNVAYYYKVRAIKTKPKGTYKKGEKSYWVSPKYSTSSARPVRQMYQNIKVNGSWHTANGFSGGTFYTLDGNSYDYLRVSSATCDYSRVNNYTKRTAENFANEITQAGIVRRNGKNRMIWVSTYTQHLYLYKWTKNGWKIERDWEVSTGKAGTPTPMSITKNKTINHHHYHRSMSYYWSCFSSHNALHARPESREPIDGEPHSNGCVRNPRERAIWIYNTLPIGTPVVAW